MAESLRSSPHNTMGEPKHNSNVPATGRELRIMPDLRLQMNPIPNQEIESLLNKLRAVPDTEFLDDLIKDFPTLVSDEYKNKFPMPSLQN